MPNANAANILTGYEKGWFDATGDLLTAKELADKTGIDFLDVLDWRYKQGKSITSAASENNGDAKLIRELI